MENTTLPNPMTLQEYTAERENIAVDAVGEMYLLLCRASVNKEITRDDMLDALVTTWNHYTKRSDDLYEKATGHKDIYETYFQNS
jgi:hypothetical protein